MNTLLFENPIQQFEAWFEQAKKDALLEMPDAACLATVNAKGRPSARMVLLKGINQKGFTIFTNQNSRKGHDLKSRPYAALTFHWPSQRRQIRIEGKVIQHPKRVADAYFSTRPRLSQIGSWASRQSEVLASREALLVEFDRLLLKYEGKKIPAPPYWQGYLIVPERVEFWQERPNRLHDRWEYCRNKKGWWEMNRLYP